MTGILNDHWLPFIHGLKETFTQCNVVLLTLVKLSHILLVRMCLKSYMQVRLCITHVIILEVTVYDRASLWFQGN